MQTHETHTMGCEISWRAWRFKLPMKPFWSTGRGVTSFRVRCNVSHHKLGGCWCDVESYSLWETRSRRSRVRVLVPRPWRRRPFRAPASGCLPVTPSAARPRQYLGMMSSSSGSASSSETYPQLLIVFDRFLQQSMHSYICIWIFKNAIRIPSLKATSKKCDRVAKNTMVSCFRPLFFLLTLALGNLIWRHVLQ